MKKIVITCFALVATIAAWAQEAVGNSKVNTDFSKYKTFSWAKSDLTAVGPNGYDVYYYEFAPEQKKAKNKSAKKPNQTYIYSYNVIIPAHDESTNGILRNSISNELEGRGYAESPKGGDLIVSYHVLDQKAALHGYINDEPTMAGAQQVRQPSDTTTYVLEPGSLVVSLIDAKTSEMVWNGFSRNMNEENKFISDEVKLREAVHKIFEEFKYTNDKARKN